MELKNVKKRKKKAGHCFGAKGEKKSVLVFLIEVGGYKVEKKKRKKELGRESKERATRGEGWSSL